MTMSADLAARLAPYLENCRDAVFLLNQRRRFIHVNEPWEKLLGVPQAEARQLSCREREPAPGLSAEDMSRSLCAPPPEVLTGKSTRVRRLRPDATPGQRWYDITFVPFADENGIVCILGRIEPVTDEVTVTDPRTAMKSTRVDPRAAARLEGLAQLREQVYGRYRFDSVHSGHASVRRAVEQARLAAQNRFPVFLHGEAGSGKEWLARAIHAASPMRERVFIALDCEHLPLARVSDVFYGEHILDGHIPVGTIYLREPGFLPRDFQVRLLEFVRETSLPSPRQLALPRIVAGSRFHHVSSPQAPSSEGRAGGGGHLHDELYHTLSVQRIDLVPLRERQVDLDALIEHFMARLNEDRVQPATGRAIALTSAALECFRSYVWPSNLRELLADLGSACAHVLASRPSGTDTGEALTVDLADLPRHVRQSVEVAPPVATDDRPLPLEQLLDETERRLILLALSRTGGNKTRAAELLSIFRPRLLRRMEALGIADPSAITEEDT